MLNLRTITSKDLVALAAEILNRTATAHPRAFAPIDYATITAFLIETQTRLRDLEEECPMNYKAGE